MEVDAPSINSLKNFLQKEEKDRWTFHGLDGPLVRQGCTSHLHQTKVCNNGYKSTCSRTWWLLGE